MTGSGQPGDQDNQVIMMNAAVYAMKMLQSSMKGEAEKAGLRSDEDVVALVKEMRSEEQECRDA